MTGCQQSLLGGGQRIASPTIVLSQTGAAAPAAVNVAFQSDGTITVGGNGSSAVPASWYVPTTVGIGASFWVRLTMNSGSNPDSGVNTIFTVPHQFTWTQSVSGTKTGSAMASFYSDAAATLPAGAISFNVTATAT